ncbi:MAG: Gfo/Idh/MocA family oxidoreductase [Firmicutes bacterium]|nr:Gfo/Idh/MocA family oxidoreductase [Bacillota bacterium]
MRRMGGGPVRVALVGCGTVALRQHLPGFRALGRDRVDVVAFASRSRVSAQAAAKAWGGGAAMERWEEAIARPDVDAVDICTPNRLHAEIAVAAARAGKHVLVEKPMALTLEEADAMIEAAAEAGVVLATAHVGRYLPAVRAAAGAVAAGRVGRVHTVEVHYAHGGPRTWAPEADWFFDPGEAGGGALIDLGVHGMDTVRAVSGQGIAEVACRTGEVREGVEYDANALCRLEGGGTAWVKASWAAPYGSDRHLAVWGEGGQLVVRGGRLTLRRADGGEEALGAEEGASLYGDFVRACRGEASPVPTGEDGRRALSAVLAGYESARRGGAPVRVR